MNKRGGKPLNTVHPSEKPSRPARPLLPPQIRLLDHANAAACSPHRSLHPSTLAHGSHHGSHRGSHHALHHGSHHGPHLDDVRAIGRRRHLLERHCQRRRVIVVGTALQRREDGKVDALLQVVHAACPAALRSAIV